MILIETARGKKLHVDLEEKFLPPVSITKNVQNEGLADILWKAGVACYRILVAHCRGGYTGSSTKNVTVY